jgi:hypothetical protein
MVKVPAGRQLPALSGATQPLLPPLEAAVAAAAATATVMAAMTSCWTWRTAAPTRSLAAICLAR